MYKEPERMRDLIADAIFDRHFDELTDVEKEKVHKIALKLRKII